VGALLGSSLRLTEHRLVYPLDDAYIHMAVARNLAEHGVWGVTRYGFTSSTSSLLWPLILAGTDAAVGPSEALPLALNVVAGVLALAIASWAVGTRPARQRLGFLLALVFFTPLAPLVLSGMEHTLHLAATLAFAGLFSRALDDEPRPRAFALAAAAAVATALRYESLFLVAAAGALLLWRGRRRLVIVTGLAGLAPPLAYALVSLAHGWYALPNSVLLKGAVFDVRAPSGLIELLGGRALALVSRTPHVMALLLVSMALLAFARLPAGPRATHGLFVIAALLHMQFADTGWLYRYEAYLVALGLLALAKSLPNDGAWWRRVARGAGINAAAVAMLAVLVGSPLVQRAVRALGETPRASKNVFDQQYQMGLFLRRFYPGASVAANDIGAISYLADVRLLDLYGLASMEAARARRANTLTRETVARLSTAHGTEIAILYRSWFARAIPREWLEVGSWQAPEQVVVADRVVSFYAVDAAARDRLAANLRAFQAQMPADIAVRLRSGEP
jgi:hypothetical protein